MLREYQARAIEGIRDEVRRGRRRVLLQAPCGAGKTTIFAKIARDAIAKGNRVLFVVHRKELVNQAHARLKGFGIDAGVIMGSDARHDLRHPAQVASIQTLARREAPDAQIVVVDEAHRALSDSYRKLLDHYSDAVVIGLTATPWRMDGRGLGDLFEGMVVAATHEELMRDGYLVKPRMFMGESPDMKGVTISMGDYQQGEVAERCRKQELVSNIVAQWQKHAPAKRTVVFAASVEHSREIVAEFSKAGVAAAHLDWSTPKEERAALLGDLESGGLQVVSNMGILTEGWDLPSLECCILARPTASSILYRQMSGRVMRPHPGKERPMLLDHGGNIRRHGFPFIDEEMELTKTKKKSRVALQCRICIQCGAVCQLNATECQECGSCLTSPESVTIIDTITELKEIPEMAPKECPKCTCPGVIIYDKRWAWNWLCSTCGERGAVAKPEAMNASMEQKKEEYERLGAVCKERGYKPGWTAHRYKSTFGVWPRGVKGES